MVGTIMIGGDMANHIRVAVAPDWPGLARGATTEESAIERLISYVPRYATVTKLPGMEAAFATIAGVDVVEH